MKKIDIVVLLAFLLLFSCGVDKQPIENEKSIILKYDNWVKEYDSLGNLTIKDYKIGYTGEQSLNQYIVFFENGNINYSKSLFVECSINSDTIKKNVNENLDFIVHSMDYKDLFVITLYVDNEKIYEKEMIDTLFNVEIPKLNKDFDLFIKVLCLKKMIIEDKEELAGPEIWINKYIILE